MAANLQLAVAADRGEAGNDVSATAFRDDGRAVGIRFALHAPYPSYYQVLFDGEPVCGVWLWLQREVNDQRPGVTLTLESLAPPDSFVFRVDFDRRACGLFDAPGDHTLTVKGWRGEPGNDFAVLAVDRDFSLAVPGRKAAYIPAADWKIPLSVFKLTPQEIQSGRVSAEQVRRVADTLETGIFFNPADGGPENPLDTFERWRASWEAQFPPTFDWLRANGFRAFATGDDWYRSPAERGWFLKTPWAADAVKYVSGRCEQYRDVLVGVECIDEFENLFGADTFAADKFIDAWRSVPNAVPVSWPGWYTGNGRTDDPRRCDYVSRYPYAAGTWAEKGYGPAGSWTLPQIRRQFEGMTAGQNPDLPLCAMTTAIPEWPAESIPMQYALGLSGGARAFRCYHFADATSGGRGVTPGTRHWDALERAAAWVRKYELRLDGHAAPMACHGPWAEGRVGALRWLVNTSERVQACPHRGRLTTADVFDAGFRGGCVPPGGVLVLD